MARLVCSDLCKFLQGTTFYFCMAATRLLRSNRTDPEVPYDQTSKRRPCRAPPERCPWLSPDGSDFVGDPAEARLSGRASNFFGPRTSVGDFLAGHPLARSPSTQTGRENSDREPLHSFPRT